MDRKTQQTRRDPETQQYVMERLAAVARLELLRRVDRMVGIEDEAAGRALAQEVADEVLEELETITPGAARARKASFRPSQSSGQGLKGLGRSRSGRWSSQSL